MKKETKGLILPAQGQVHKNVCVIFDRSNYIGMEQLKLHEAGKSRAFIFLKKYCLFPRIFIKTVTWLGDISLVSGRKLMHC